LLPTANISSTVNTNATAVAEARPVPTPGGHGSEPVTAVAPIAPPLRAESREDRGAPAMPRSEDGAGGGARERDEEGGGGTGAARPAPPLSALPAGLGEVAHLPALGDPFDPLRPARAATAYAAGLRTLPGVAGWNAGTVIDRQG